MKKKICLASFFSLALPFLVFAADWRVGMDSNNNWSIEVGSNGSLSGGGFALNNPYGLPGGSILGIVSNLLFWLLSIFAIAGIVGFVISGILYLVSTGDDNMITRAKTAMKYSILGIIVGLSGFIIMQAVVSLLSGTTNKF